VVRVACRGIPEFSSVEIPKTHPAFRLADDPPSIEEVLSTSFSVFKEKPAAAWRDGGADAFDNPAIPSLYCHVRYSWSEENTTLGRVPDRWSHKIGTVLVLRRDKRDISVDWVRALCELCQSQVTLQANAFREAGANIRELHDWIREEIEPLLPHGPF